LYKSSTTFDDDDDYYYYYDYGNDNNVLENAVDNYSYSLGLSSAAVLAIDPSSFCGLKAA
jgi:hypothetical protein